MLLVACSRFLLIAFFTSGLPLVAFSTSSVLLSVEHCFFCFLKPLPCLFFCLLFSLGLLLLSVNYYNLTAISAFLSGHFYSVSRMLCTVGSSLVLGFQGSVVMKIIKAGYFIIICFYAVVSSGVV